MIDALLFTLLLAPQTAAEAGRRFDQAAPALVVAAPVYQPDGSVSADTAVLAGASPHVVHVAGRSTLCEIAVAGAAEPREAAFGWRVTSQTLSATASAVVVSIDWQRVWDRGKKIANGPSGTVQLTLHPGDRIPLDVIPNAAADRRVPRRRRGARSPAGASAGGRPAGGQHADPARRDGRRIRIARCRLLARPQAALGRRADTSSDDAADGGGGIVQLRAGVDRDGAWRSRGRRLGHVPALSRADRDGVSLRHDGADDWRRVAPGGRRDGRHRDDDPAAGAGRSAFPRAASDRAAARAGVAGAGRLARRPRAAGADSKAAARRAAARAVVRRRPGPAGSAGAGSGGGVQTSARARGGGGGAAGSGDATAASVARLIQTVGVLEGHTFSLRVRFTPVQ